MSGKPHASFHHFWIVFDPVCFHQAKTSKSQRAKHLAIEHHGLHWNLSNKEAEPVVQWHSATNPSGAQNAKEEERCMENEAKKQSLRWWKLQAILHLSLSSVRLLHHRAHAYLKRLNRNHIQQSLQKLLDACQRVFTIHKWLLGLSRFKFAICEPDKQLCCDF